jgi:hypothetical protein
MVAVSEVPSPLTTMFENVMAESFKPFAVMNLSAEALLSPTPLSVIVVEVFRDKLLGERL